MRRVAALCLLLTWLGGARSCGEDQVRQCVGMAEPMLREARLIFPDNARDLEEVCRSWQSFVECVARYTEACFSKPRKEQFKWAVEPPIASVQQMCSQSAYQAEYLRHAGCIKATVIEAQRCGPHYSALVAEVSREDVRKPELCCAYRQLRSCVILQTRLRCDADRQQATAASFSRQLLDKAFRFLQDQCLGVAGRTSDCPRTSRPGEARSVLLDSSSAPPSFTNDLDAATSSAAKSSSKINEETPAARKTEADGAITRRTPSGAQNEHARATTSDGPLSKSPRDFSMATVSQRSAGYARGMSWTSASSVAASSPVIPDWATNSWLQHGQELTTEDIYPAAGSFGGNNIDEPNQQGLSRNAARRGSILLPLPLIFLPAIFYCSR